MVPEPIIENPNYVGSGKLKGKAALGSSIINTASVVAYVGPKDLIDYTATKSAIVGFTRALANNLISQGIRVNAIAPGQPFEVAPTFVYLASDDSRYVTGQVLHVDGGQSTSS